MYFLITAGFIAFLLFPDEVVGKACPVENYGELDTHSPSVKGCSEHEYCCRSGCCLLPAFHFYQLWYYWLLVVFMFLLCSGGGWWYRFWFQGQFRGRYPASITNGTMNQPFSDPGIYNVTARRITRPRAPRSNTRLQRQTLVLPRIWKGPESSAHHSRPPPPYSAQPHNSSDTSMGPQMQLQHTTSEPNANADPSLSLPYYQLYGPPPSYEAAVSGDHNVSDTLLQFPDRNEVNRNELNNTCDTPCDTGAHQQLPNTTSNPEISNNQTSNLPANLCQSEVVDSNVHTVPNSVATVHTSKE